MAVNISKLHIPGHLCNPARTSAMRLQSTERDENVHPKSAKSAIKRFEISALDPDKVLRSKQVKYAGALWYLLIKKRKKDEEELHGCFFLHCDRLLKVSLTKPSSPFVIGSVQEESCASNFLIFVLCVVLLNCFCKEANAIFDEKCQGQGSTTSLLGQNCLISQWIFGRKRECDSKSDFSARGISNIEAVSRIVGWKSTKGSCLFIRDTSTPCSMGISESSQEEIKIDGVSVAEFITLLEAIYPPIVIIKLLKQMLSACFIWLTDFK
uniref:Uncharacterized protein n=1 Tax=Ditylenchus dipsaci TaxID=166011 RepID=A0A915DLT9_9BILA